MTIFIVFVAGIVFFGGLLWLSARSILGKLAPPNGSP